ncbi:hypothetical protein, partial [Desulfovibrio sp.]|uniref:hypothetical protein n=1 Tax=Desulfovibrio sp. TaxID=885 RepID=UPI0025C030D0
QLRAEYGNHVYVGARVCHVKDSEIAGTITNVDDNLSRVTTCNVVWDDDDSGHDIQWTNKLMTAATAA